MQTRSKHLAGKCEERYLSSLLSCRIEHNKEASKLTDFTKVLIPFYEFNRSVLFHSACKGAEGSRGEQRGAKGSRGEQRGSMGSTERANTERLGARATVIMLTW